MASGGRLAGAPPLPPMPPLLPPLPSIPPNRAPSENRTPISVPLLSLAGSGAGADAPLARWLRRLEAFLAVSGLSASTPLGVAFAASALAVVGVALPAVAVSLSPCRKRERVCDEFEVEMFEVCVMMSQAAAAAVAVACVSRKMAMYGLRKFLFVDPELGMRIRFQKEYVVRIQDFFRTLMWWILPCFTVKVTREMFDFSHMFHDSIWRSCIVLFASIMSWMYLTTIVLSSCMLFNLVCNLLTHEHVTCTRGAEGDTPQLAPWEIQPEARYARQSEGCFWKPETPHSREGPRQGARRLWAAPSRSERP